MSISNPNRFVTGLSDISYVRQVDRVQTTRCKDQVVVPSESEKPLTIREKTLTKDRFVPDTFTPETLPDNV